jgi:A/G-specific adenine glycosylase
MSRLAIMTPNHTSEGVRVTTSDLGIRLAAAADSVPPPRVALEAFRKAVLGHYREHGRDLPWRHTCDPYSILVSEVMLQQTQVTRVLPMYVEFLAAFPTVLALSRASLAEVLSAWQGLGYNRRALALHQAARLIATEHNGIVPSSPTELLGLPGIGPATAAAVCVFAHNAPLAFIETNIRSVYLHFFFQECVSVPDAAILPLVELTLDHEEPRDWYYALMDCGAWIKRNLPNPNRRSRCHAVQTRFEGSHRQLRAAVLRSLLSASATVTPSQISARLALPAASVVEVAVVLGELTAEGFLVRPDGGYKVA